MNLFFLDKHRKPTKFEIKVKEMYNNLKAELKYDPIILWLDLKILWYDLSIGWDLLMDKMVKLIDAHDEKWDRFDDMLVSYVEGGRAKISSIKGGGINGLD